MLNEIQCIHFGIFFKKKKKFQKYYHLQPNQNLRNLLKNKNIIEFPTIEVIENENIDKYEIVEDETSLKKINWEIHVPKPPQNSTQIEENEEEEDIDENDEEYQKYLQSIPFFQNNFKFQSKNKMRDDC